MSECHYLKGPNIAPKTVSQARKLTGTFVQYLAEEDIDKSGRGYIFPRYGFVEGGMGRDVIISGDYISISRIREMTEASPQ